MTARPIYQRIADTLRDAIESGELGPGSRLPSEAELCRRFGAAQGTVRGALAVLRGEGLIHAEHGRGVFVRPRREGHHIRCGRLIRTTDVTGLSGTGVVAEVAAFSDGTTVVRWLPTHPPHPTIAPTTVIHDTPASVLAIHGHHGATTLEWLDTAPRIEREDTP
jgi:GntR family transcriptional regulator